MKIKRLLSFVLVIVSLFVFSVGDSALAITNEVKKAVRINEYISSLEDKPAEQLAESQLIGEDISKREENIKHFVREDKAVEAVVYPYPVHYQKDGKWVDIDNRLELSKDENGNSVYCNKEGSFFISFATGSGSDQIVRIKQDKYSISWKLNGSEANSDARLIDSKNEASQDMRVLPNLFSTISYDNVFGENNLSYIVGPMGVSEYIEIDNTNEVAESYTVEITCNGLTPKVEDNAIHLYDQEGNEIFRIDAPYMIDAVGEVCDDIVLQLVPTTEEKEQSDATTNTDTDGSNAASASLNAEETTNAACESTEIETENPEETKGSSDTEGGAFQNPTETAEFTGEEENDGSVLETSEEKEETEPTPSPVLDTETVNEEATTEPEKTDEAIDDISGISGENGVITFTYKMIPSQKWLNAKERQYPVIIDPDIRTSLNSSQVYDTYVSSGDANSNFYTSTKLKIGNGSSSGISRTYIEFPNLPTLGAGDMVIGATASIERKNSNQSNDLRVDLHEVTGSWTSSTLTWNNKPGYNTDRVEAIAYSVLPGNYNSWDITRLVKEWYNGEANNGFMLKLYDESWGYLEYYSVDDYYAYNSHPYATVTYINTTGLEDSWTFHSQNIGRAGTASVNDYNGNLVLVHNDVNIDSGVMPIALSHVFNSNDKMVDLGYGYGWRLNYGQTVAAVTLNSVNYYKHIDGDGTAHYYKQSTSNSALYENELDKETTLTVSGSTETITDKQGNCLVFNSSGRLYQMKDSNNNTLTVNYNANGTIASVVDGANRTTSFIYTNNRLSGIDSPDGLDVSYTYDSSGRLTGITYADNESSSYTYNSNGDITCVQNYDGYRVAYGYTTTAPYRVNSIAESDGITTGGSIGISYGWNSTTFTDNADRKSIYQFNNAGQTVAIRDTDGSAQYCEFNTGNRTETQLKNVSKLQKTSINLLMNHNMENSSTWSMTSGASYSSTFAYMGSRSIRLYSTNTTTPEYASQTVTLTPGHTYTLSAYFKGVDGACVSIVYGSTEVSSSGINGASTEWGRESLTFTLPSGSSSSASVRVKLPAAVSGTAYADCVMLEEADAMNRYNLLENGDFINSSTSWTRGSSLTASDLLMTTSDTLHPSSLDSNVYKLIGSTTAEKVVSQTVNVSGSSGDCFTFGGWALINTVPAFTKNEGQSTEVKYGQRKLTVGFVGASETQYYSISFNPDCTDWQYICGAAIAPFSYTSIVFRFEYNYNCNDAYFDGMQMFKEEFAQSFTYDGDGNVISVQGLADQNSAFSYNGSNDLIEATDAKGNKFNYTYDSNHNLLTATSETGMKYTFTYDSKGDALTSRTGSDTDYIQTSASYTTTGSFLSSVTDARGKTVNYSYDTNKGLRTSVTDPKGETSTYSYDAMKRLSGLSQTIGNNTAQVGYTYTNDDLTQVSHNGFTYGMTYDLFGNTLTTQVNGTTLSTNTYNYSRGLLSSTAYGNGLTVNYTYDDMDRVTEVRFGSTLMYSYSYDGDGNLQRLVDHLRSITATYYYDLTGRLIRSVSSDGAEYRYEYDLNNNLTKLYQTAGGSSWTTEYTYDKDNRPLTTKVGTKTITDSYNATGTRASRVYGFTTPYTVSLTYLAGINGSKTGILGSYRNGSEIAYIYTYDDNGNIASITQGDRSSTYVYDEMNQLVRANDGFANLTTTYAYDLGGNITQRNEYAYTTGALGTPTDTISYTYDSAWADKLVSYDGQSITYDEIGNPLTYRGYTLTWQGKRLQTLSGNSTSASYTYNEEGVRTSKTVNGVATSYDYNGSLLMAQTTGSGTGQIKQLYSYDASGQLVSVNYNSTEYFYLRNGQNDIVGIMDGNGTKVVRYAYDSWGKLVSTTGTLATTLGANNPFRYRGYYYDTETGLYYLQTRYYDPEVCRFISADVYMSTGQGIVGNNMFAYCNNCPTNLVDETGTNPALPILSLADYYIIHQTIATIIAFSMFPYGQIEVGVVGSRGYGRLDVYNSITSEYYEVKSEKASMRKSTQTQMAKYDVAHTVLTQKPVSRGTQVFSGNFYYGAWLVEYKSNGNGLVTYTTTYDAARALTGLAILGAAVLTYYTGGAASPLLVGAVRGLALS